MTIVENLFYAAEHGSRGAGDLHLPDTREGAPLALVTHGGSWNAMDRRRMSGVAELLGRGGYAAYNINYRLAYEAPWPACREDCLRAALYLLEGSNAAFDGLDRSGLLVIGASAGGHLALMTGLSSLRGRVRGIVSISGPADLTLMTRPQDVRRIQALFGTTDHSEEMLREASPVGLVTRDAPPLLCVHSVSDALVPIAHSEAIAERYAEVGAHVDLYAYDGPGTSHGIWCEGSDPPRLLSPIEEAIGAFIHQLRERTSRL